MNKRFDNIWDAIEDTPEEAENMKIRSALMMDIQGYIKRHKLTQREAARLFGVTQPRISELMHGRISLFAIDKLVSMATHAGLKVEITVRQPAARKSAAKAKSSAKKARGKVEVVV